jgi:catechol 2,3-dioxygenase-like lactoylglutathione lyase family enzyme
MTPRLSAIGLVVGDLARSLDFYRRLGLDVPEVSDSGHVEIALPGGLRLLVDTEDVIKSFDPSWTPPGPGGHRIGLAFECASPADVDRVVGDLEAAGSTVHLAPFDAPWGQRYATVHDPDGNGVDLFAAF